MQALLLTRCGLKRRLVRSIDVYASPDIDTAPGLLVRSTPIPPCGVFAARLFRCARAFCCQTLDALWCPSSKVLLCGAGAVAAGQWARRLCINETLTTGSVMPYVGAHTNARSC